MARFWTIWDEDAIRIDYRFDEGDDRPLNELRSMLGRELDARIQQSVGEIGEVQASQEELPEQQESIASEG